MLIDDLEPDSLVSLAKHLQYCKTENCCCHWAYRNLGNLYVSMGRGWVRVTTEKNCKHHGKQP